MLSIPEIKFINYLIYFIFSGWTKEEVIWLDYSGIFCMIYCV